jgi:hypothetical protein
VFVKEREGRIASGSGSASVKSSSFRHELRSCVLAGETSEADDGISDAGQIQNPVVGSSASSWVTQRDTDLARSASRILRPHRGVRLATFEVPRTNICGRHSAIARVGLHASKMLAECVCFALSRLAYAHATTLPNAHGFPLSTP